MGQSPNLLRRNRAGIWGTGSGIAADSAGNIYATTSEGPWTVGSGGQDYGESLVKLSLQQNISNGTYALNVVDYFTPSDYGCRYQDDIDLGSSGPMLLPTQAGLAPNEIIVASKGWAACDSGAPIYRINRDALGGLAGQLQVDKGPQAGYWSSPAFWHGASGPNCPSGGYVYLGGFRREVLGQAPGIGDNLRAYCLTNGALGTYSATQSPNLFHVGVTPVVSSNGTTNGIVWALEHPEDLEARPPNLPFILHAYDATNLGIELYNSSQAGTRDTAGASTKFQVPTVANGKVYVGGQVQLDVYGLCPCPQ